MKGKLLLFLSIYNGKGSYEKYYTQNKEEYYEGEQTNEAPVKYLLKKARADGNPIDQIICIVSDKVKNDKSSLINKNGELCSTLEFFKERIQDYAQQENYPTKLEFAEIEYEGSGEDNSRKIYNDIENKLIHKNKNRPEESKVVYLDYSGGMRDTNFLMASIVRYLEFFDINCKSIACSNITDKTIYEIQYIYTINQLINGVNEFINSADARTLKKVMQENQIEDETTKALLESLISYANIMVTCDVSKLEKAAAEIEKQIHTIEKIKDGNIYIQMLKTLVPAVRDKMHVGKKISYPKIIRWCVENDLIQQAITLYVEKMPIYLWEQKGLLPAFLQDNIYDPKNKPGTDPRVDRFYEILFDTVGEGVELRAFKKLMEEVASEIGQNDWNNVDLVIRKIMQQKYTNPLFESALQRLCSYLDKHYKNPKSSDGKVEVDFYGLTAKDGEKLRFSLKEFVDKLKGPEYQAYCHYMVYKKQTLYDEIPKPSGEEKSQEYTYRKKMHAILMLDDQKRYEECEFSKAEAVKLQEHMKYYLAIKLLRNQMNHANENENTVDEQEVIKQFRKMGIEVSREYNAVVKLLQDALIVIEE